LYLNEKHNDFYVDVGLNVFMMTRKGVNDGKPFPGALPSMSVGNRYVGVNLTYMPKKAIEEITPTQSMDKTMQGVVFLQFKVNVAEIILDLN